MRHEAHIAPLADRLSAAFEHSITWEDDIWRADPVDVELVHAQRAPQVRRAARRRHRQRAAPPVQARILLFHGQSGAGKTHLIRALRTAGASRRQGLLRLRADDAGRGQLRRLLPAPAGRLAGEALRPRPRRRERAARLTNRLVGDAAVRGGGHRSTSCATPSSAMPRSPSWCSASPTRSWRRRSSPARTSTSTSCARCSTCSAPTRASTSACASISMAAKLTTCRRRRWPRSIPTRARAAPSRSSSRSAA